MKSTSLASSILVVELLRQAQIAAARIDPATLFVLIGSDGAAGIDADDVLVQGYANGYAHYLTTPEEYDAQRYEAGSTVFGRNELAAFVEAAQRLASDTGSTAVLADSADRDALTATVAARAGVDALIRGLNAAYGVRAHSTIFGFMLAYALTLVIVGISLAGLATIVVVPVLLNFLVFAPVRASLLTVLPWAGMFLLVIVTIGVLYRYGPNVKTPRTPIFTWGALFAAVLWSAGSIAFSAYLCSFNSYNRIYGSIGTVVALLMWFYLAGFSIMLGALINVELARRVGISAPPCLRRVRTLEEQGFIRGYHADIDALYAAIGDGHVSTEAVMRALVKAHGGEEAATEDMAEATTPRTAPRSRAGDPGVTVVGTDDVWVKLARCCTPVPGDDIVGFVTTGSGVSVHREDCTNIENLRRQPERLIDVAWAPGQASVFLVQLQVEALDRSGLLSDITRALSDQHVNILSAALTTATSRCC